MLKVDVDTERIGARTRPYCAVDAVFRNNLRIHAAVARQDEHILHRQGKADIGLPFAYGPECISKVYVIQPEEGCILKEIVRIPLLSAVRRSESGLLDQTGFGILLLAVAEEL